MGVSFGRGLSPAQKSLTNGQRSLRFIHRWLPLNPQSCRSAFGCFCEWISALACRGSVNKHSGQLQVSHNGFWRAAVQPYFLQKNGGGMNTVFWWWVMSFAPVAKCVWQLGRALWGETLSWRLWLWRSVFSPTVVPDLMWKWNICHVTSLFLLYCVPPKLSRVMWKYVYSFQIKSLKKWAKMSTREFEEHSIWWHSFDMWSCSAAAVAYRRILSTGKHHIFIYNSFFAVPPELRTTKIIIFMMHLLEKKNYWRY